MAKIYKGLKIKAPKVKGEDDAAVIDDQNKQELSWVDSGGRRRRATLPLVIFSGHAA